ncbi:MULTISPECIES: hypothetical protein [Corynebacterium]|uniref:hypothetical protein n=1 Tax=Corynebacterium TaxID=1716 RepID=UPI0011C94F54|nr:hypothetical protein [Corynebacterium sp. LK14]TXS64621.1 hypothetical protein CHU71_04350 [Corynebacterium sp. LK14]HAT1360267.1 hypothetical protein [Corynebacterium striatum]
MAESDLRPYRVVLRSGFETTLMLSRETAERDYPTAREVATGGIETKDGAPKKSGGRSKKATAAKSE